ncbi:hypothetical protein PYW08_013089 [Mythimna loreyi]|uniref:Uncharacterized protein n=1 Tax=Mythimna loreyi TaxID=667449 RepID=A0ACC2Q1F8_9NEOP|nr:hypothetical protein PYW08_013089 [Mythimna loreyi]
MCFALPKITYLMRTTPTWLCPEEVSSFDNALKLVVQSVLNVSLDEPQWRQAALPIRCGGLGVRCARDVGLPAFLASAHGVANLVTVLLGTNGDGGSMPLVSDAVSAWLSLSSGAAIPESKHVQRAWDDIGVKLLQEQLLGGAMGVDKARLRAVSQPESGAWLQAIPSPHLGTLLDDDSLRVAVALRLGCRVCESHTYTCGSMVEADGHHALSCRRCTGSHIYLTVEVVMYELYLRESALNHFIADTNYTFEPEHHEVMMKTLKTRIDQVKLHQETLNDVATSHDTHRYILYSFIFVVVIGICLWISLKLRRRYRAVLRVTYRANPDQEQAISEPQARTDQELAISELPPRTGQDSRTRKVDRATSPASC